MLEYKPHLSKYTKRNNPKKKFGTIPFLLESPRNKEFQPPDLEIDFFN